MQGTQVQSLDQEDATCCRASKPVHRNSLSASSLRSATREAAAVRSSHTDEEQPPLAEMRESLRVAMKTQNNQKLNLKHQPALNGSIWSVRLSSGGTWHPVSWCSVVWISIAWLPFFCVMTWDRNKYLIGLPITWKLVVGISLQPLPGTKSLSDSKNPWGSYILQPRHFWKYVSREAWRLAAFWKRLHSLGSSDDGQNA